jgi:hypothetical protein
MTTMPAPYDTDPYSTYRTNGDMECNTLPRPARPTANRRPDGLVVDATGLWTGGLATAAVAALVGLVGTLVVRVLFQLAPVATQTVHSFDPAGAGMLCLLAAVAALAATGIAHLLLVSTPEPLVYLGWIVGLATATTTVLPLLSGLPMVAAIAAAVVNLVIGLAIGSLVVGAAGSALRVRIR